MATIKILPGSEILQVFDHSSSQHAIPLLTEYDVTIHTRDQFKMGSAEYGHGFTLFKAGTQFFKLLERIVLMLWIVYVPLGKRQ